MKKLNKWTLWGLLLLICIVHTSCKTNKNKSLKTFVISSLSKSDNLHFCLPTNNFREKEYYQEFNFIIDSTGSVYYYYIQPGEFGIMAGPVFANLRPGNIIKVPEFRVINFLIENVIEAKKNNIAISIASQKDTIQSLGFMEMYYYLRDNTADINYYIRTTTTEENVVLFFKKRKEYYDPARISWDSTKTIFINAPIVAEEK